ncbi:hypothetical protein M3147_12380 [Agromyces mediolanus]|uniref:hypothetical protein n=1 Tax=Agromyces mediolanus TaxID=41986 RepID=UPI002041B22D|nr:hypothetical protein [Agromyces mediolanus]MCM3658049.1 hypothetical protein [Agromyces mediolanus]
MDGLANGLKRLDAAQTTEQLIDALWDLRDSAYDEPERWSTFTAEELLQRLTSELDRDDAVKPAVEIPVPELGQALARALDPHPRDRSRSTDQEPGAEEQR